MGLNATGGNAEGLFYGRVEWDARPIEGLPI